MDPNDTPAPAQDTPAPADTVEQQASTASEVTSETPEATQGTGSQEATPTEVNATDTVEEKLFAGKYKTADEMEKAYLNLQSKATKDSQEKAELSRILNEAYTTPAPTADTGDGFSEEPDPVTQEIERLKHVTAVQSFIITHPDADAVAMQKVLSEDSMIKQISGADARLEYAFLKSKNMASPKAIEEARQTAANQATAKIAEKQAAQVETAQKAEEVQDSLLEKATGNYTYEDRQKARQELIRKHLVNL